MTPDDERHGTTRGYHAGCKEACCRRAMARYEKAGRLARLNGGRAVLAIGAQRRLQALMRLGWSSNRIAEEAGLIHRNHVWRILNGQKGKPTIWIQRSTHEWVCEVYDRLSMQVPNDGAYASRTRAHAERKGWPPPLAWDDIDNPDEQPRRGPARPLKTDIDPVVVQRVLGGDRLPTTHAEKVEITRRWEAQGRTLKDLEQLTGWRSDRYTVREAS